MYLKFKREEITWLDPKYVSEEFVLNPYYCFIAIVWSYQR